MIKLKLLKNKLPVLVSLSVIIACSLIFQNCAGFLSVPVPGMNQAASAEASQVPVGQVRRLSMTEYVNSLNDAVLYQYTRNCGGCAYMGPNTTYDESVLNAISALPADIAPTKLSTPELSMAVSDDTFSGYMGVANAIAARIVAAGWLGPFVSGCATSNSTLDSACVDRFITEFGGLAFRTPPTADERAELKANLADYATLIARILVHPRFLTHIERDGAVSPDGSYQLTAYEIEARMAAIYLKSVPDVAGLQVAASGSLSTPSGRRAEAVRLLGTQRAKDVMWMFYQQYLGAQRVPLNYGADEPIYDTFSAPIANGTLNAYPNQFHTAVLQDAHDFLEYLTFGTGTLSDIFRSPLIFTMDSSVATYYGVTPRANSSAPPITDSSGHYHGILTRQIVTQQNPQAEGETNHIQRGVFILSNIVGVALGPPAASALQQAAGVTIPAGASTRIQQVMQTSATSCQACHRAINPAGFALANFDTLGRYQTVEKRYSLVNNAATIVASNAIDATTYIPLNGTFYAVQDVPTLVNALFNSGVVYDGFAKYYFSFAFGRTATSSADTQLLNNFKTDLQTLSLMNALANLAQQPTFATAVAPN